MVSRRPQADPAVAAVAMGPRSRALCPTTIWLRGSPNYRSRRLSIAAKIP